MTVTHPEMTRYFMIISEAVSLILQAGAMADSYGIYVLEMGRPVKIVDLATKMIEVMGARGVRLKYVGLRPGEKLHETLSEESERRVPTDHAMVFRLLPKNPPPRTSLTPPKRWPSPPARATTRRPWICSAAPSQTTRLSRAVPRPEHPKNVRALEGRIGGVASSKPDRCQLVGTVAKLETCALLGVVGWPKIKLRAFGPGHGKFGNPYAAWWPWPEVYLQA